MNNSDLKLNKAGIRASLSHGKCESKSNSGCRKIQMKDKRNCIGEGIPSEFFTGFLNLIIVLLKKSFCQKSVSYYIIIILSRKNKANYNGHST